MLKNDYPLFFDTTEIKAKRLSWNIVFENIENSIETEDGVESVEVIRRGKRGISATFQCLDYWVSILAAFNDQPEILVKYYDVVTRNYIERYMRMDGLSVDEAENSDTLDISNGAYVVSFNLLEF